MEPDTAPRFTEVDHCQQACGGEHLAGDLFHSRSLDDGGRVVSVLADGLSSGVEAAVLASVTAAMALEYVEWNIDTGTAARILMDSLPVEPVRCTWARCLELMKSGEADLLSSAYKKPDRKVYMTYFDQSYLDQLPIAFYTLKSKNVVVQKYEDIYQFDNIGVLRDASYFDRFDHDTHAKKFEVTSQEQLFPMLLTGRIDAMAGYVPTENYRLSTGGYRSQIERSTYVYQEQALVYMTISNLSPLLARLQELNQINSVLLTDGTISRIINAYYEKYQ